MSIELLPAGVKFLMPGYFTWIASRGGRSRSADERSDFIKPVGVCW